MKLAIDTRSFNEVQNLTGIGFFARAMTNAIIENNDPFIEDITLLSSGLNKKSSVIDSKKVKQIHINLPNKILNLSWFARLGPRIDKKLGSVNCIWLPNLNVYDFKSKIPYILTIHDLSFIEHPEFFNLKRNIWHNMTKFTRLINAAKLITTVSQSTKSDILRFFPNISESKIHVIYNGIEKCNCFKSTEQLLDNKFGSYILFLGTIEPRKNIYSVIEAFKILKKRT